jgi:hypothetical protein
MEKYSNHPLAGAKDLDSGMNLLWAFYKKHFVVLYVISVFASLASTFITSGIDLTALQSTTDPTELLAIYKTYAVPYFLLIIISLIFSIVIQAYILDKPIDQPYSFLDSLKKSVVALFPYLCAIILMAIPGVLLIAIGIILLIIPGLFAAFYFFTVCLFTLPIILIESRNPGYAINRSLRLTHRNFWSNIGWVVVIGLLVMIFSLVISALVMLPFTGTFIKSLSDPAAALEMAKNPLYIILASLTGALVTPVFPIMSLILYFRNAEEEVKEQKAVIAEEGRVRVEDLYPKMPENNTNN